ncbi:rod shape-determining protein RodA [Oceanobacillus sojae]|uniref:Rod shape-determining protein RodA n=1 Tax=Oceanobacillus sojae TaxID=582851 RepID=A0A511ZDV7_9BACI|nr:rod shape-determining protein RodA [Oceanobacillus sojae]GEN85638.1 rod shape-determining protein RodA [Oceanobacillus sojae]
MQQKKYNLDYSIIIILFLLFLISLIAIYSGSGQYAQSQPFYFVIRQAVWYVFGILIMLAVIFFDYELLKHQAFRLYAIGTFLLICVHFFGVFRNGSQRWLNLGFFEVQPSEFIKIFLIIYLAVLLERHGNRKLSLKMSIQLTAKIMAITLIPFVFIFLQPDLGSALTIFAIAFTMIIVSSISIKVILPILFSMAASVAGLIFIYAYYFDAFSRLFQSHQMERIYGWLNPSEYASDYGYQLQQAIMGIGSGQLSGAGFNQGLQIQNGKVPEAHTDFIFTVIGEEYGFIGASILILLYFLLLYRITKVAYETNNLFGVYLCVGVIGILAFQVFQNIAMTIGLMPITGITLPFISYGGSSLITNLMMVGLVISVQIRSSRDDLFRKKAISD